MKIVFFGTPDFAANILSDLIAARFDIVAVVSKPDRPKGRSGTPVPPPVKTIAQELIPNIPVYQPEKASSPDFSKILENHHADIFVVVAYGEIIKQHLLDMPKLGCINVHASILPKYRGAAPIQQSIINGDAETGITIMHMVLKMDAGDIIKIIKVPIDTETTAGELESDLCVVGSTGLIEVLHDFEKGKIYRTAQDESKVTYAPKIELEDCEIDWHTPASQIHNLIRGVNPHPGAWCFVHWKEEKKRLKIYKSVIVDLEGPVGTILSLGKEGLTIACGEKALCLQFVQLEGKKAMPTAELVRGIPIDELTFFI